jgi:carboxymethylenebutenolidase
VVVISEIWGLVPHIEDIARRVALEGFLAIAPDLLTHLGGTPENPDEAVKMVRGLDPEETTKNLVAAVKYIKTHPQSTGKVGVTGFCWGGGMTGQVAVNSPEVEAAVPFYGRQPESKDVSKIKASLLVHYAGEDERINACIPEFEDALKKSSIEHIIHIYEGARHGFMNNTKDWYNEEAAKLAWKRTIDFFKEKLK